MKRLFIELLAASCPKLVNDDSNSMTSDRKQKPSNSIPISFFDEDDSRLDSEDENMSEEQAEREVNHEPERADSGPESRVGDSGLGGPELAELVAVAVGAKTSSSGPGRSPGSGCAPAGGL